MSQTPRDVAHRWWQEIWNQRRIEVVEELFAADGIGHLQTGDIVGPAGFRSFFEAVTAAFPDLQVTVEDLVADGPHVVVRWTTTGTHTGAALGPKPTGRRVIIRGMTWITVRDGRVVEGWDSWNLGGLLRELES